MCSVILSKYFFERGCFTSSLCEAAEYGRYCAYHQLSCEFESSSWQHYLKNFFSDFRQVGVFFSSTPVTSTNATARHDMTEIALQVVLNTITLTLILSRGVMPSSTVDRGFDCLSDQRKNNIIGICCLFLN